MTYGNYYHMAVRDTEAEITIYGDINEYDAWDERATSAYTLAKKIEALGNVRKINVNINSLGGDVKEGIAIHNALKRHPAKVTTRCDGWACSIASVIFMAGDNRIMYPTSLLMIHNAWTYAMGNADEMRKLADDLDIITSSSKAAYLEHVNIGEGELSRMMDEETWITPDEALAMGFATKVEKMAEPKGAIHQSVRGRLFDMITAPTVNAAAESEGSTEEHAVNLVCVTGAPCSGKSTYVSERIGEGDAVFDYDAMLSAVTFRGMHEAGTEAQSRLCLYLRKALISGAKAVGIENAYVIATSPSESLREALGECQYVEVESSLDECLANLRESDRPNKEAWEAAIRDYFGAEPDDEPDEETEPDEGEEENVNEAAMAAFFMALDNYLGGKQHADQ